MNLIFYWRIIFYIAIFRYIDSSPNSYKLVFKTPAHIFPYRPSFRPRFSSDQSTRMRSAMQLQVECPAWQERVHLSALIAVEPQGTRRISRAWEVEVDRFGSQNSSPIVPLTPSIHLSIFRYTSEQTTAAIVFPWRIHLDLAPPLPVASL